MRDINITHLTDNAQLLGTRSQSQYQYNNISVSLYQVTAAMPGVNVGEVILRESDADTRDYVLDVNETQKTLTDIDEALRSYAQIWADNDDNYQLERYRWGLYAPVDDAVINDYDKPCKIVVAGSYYGYAPYDYACDEQSEALIFACAAEAQAWIDAHNKGTYYLGNNEAGRPTYTIVKA